MSAAEWPNSTPVRTLGHETFSSSAWMLVVEVPWLSRT